MQKVHPHLGSSKLGRPCAIPGPGAAHLTLAGPLWLGHTARAAAASSGPWPRGPQPTMGRCRVSAGGPPAWLAGPHVPASLGRPACTARAEAGPCAHFFKMAETCKIHNKLNKKRKMTNPILLDSTQIVLCSEHIKSHALVQNNLP